jgi:hypothetical protein
VFDVVFNVFVGSALENTALDGLKMALGMPTGADSHPHPEMKSLEEQEDALEKAVGAVMQCGRLVSTISAEPLLAAGIQMMCEIDRCRELNKMINASLFESPDALKSFSTCWYYMLVVVLPVISGVQSVFLL